MKLSKSALAISLCCIAIALPSVVAAQDTTDTDTDTSTDTTTTTEENKVVVGSDNKEGSTVAEDDDMKKKREGKETDKDPRPKPPGPKVLVKEDKVEEQAGTGGTIAYASAGVLELGGTAGFNAAGDLIQAQLSPTIGWFFADNIQLSGILGFQYADTGGSSAVTVSALVEPSYHLPLTDSFFIFGGVGAGVLYAEGAGTGFAIVPRLGVNVLVGRSGIFTPSINAGYSTVEASQTSNGTLLTVEPSFGINAGYTVMW